MTESNNIPKHWQLKKLGEVCQFIGGGTPSKKVISYWKGNIPWASIKDIKGTFLTKTTDFISEEGVKNSATNIASPGELIIATRINPGRVILSKIKTAINQDLKIARPKLHTNVSFLLYSFQNLERNIIKVSSGTTVLGINLNLLNEIKIPIPPLPEQQAIVSKIEELLSELDNGIAQLKTAKQQLKVYRQSLLKWAFEGKLTNENVKEGELPKGWKVVKLGALMESVRNGYSKKPDENGKYKILRISSVRPNKVYVDEVRLLEKEIGIENSLNENDILFTRYNGSIDFVGVCGRVPKLKEPLYYPDKLIRCRPLIKDWFHSAYIDYAANSRQARQFVLSKIKTTAGQTGISGSDIKEIPISLAPMKEQQLIVSELESKLTVCDKIEETISQSLQQAETLRQSILKKAFEGKLVKMKQ